MPEETAQINEILGKLEQEVENLRDSETIKLIKPFIDETDKLVKKIESVNFPAEFGEVKKEIKEIKQSIDDNIYKKIKMVIDDITKISKNLNFIFILVLINILILLVIAIIIFIK